MNQLTSPWLTLADLKLIDPLIKHFWSNQKEKKMSSLWWCRDLQASGPSVTVIESSVCWRQPGHSEDEEKTSGRTAAVSGEYHSCTNAAPLKKKAHLTERALQLPEEIVIFQGVRVVVDVVHAKLEPLHHLKIVVEHKLLGELGVQTVEDHLCAAKLVPKTAHTYCGCQVIQCLVLHKECFFCFLFFY